MGYLGKLHSFLAPH